MPDRFLYLTVSSPGAGSTGNDYPRNVTFRDRFDSEILFLARSPNVTSSKYCTTALQLATTSELSTAGRIEWKMRRPPAEVPDSHRIDIHQIAQIIHELLFNSEVSTRTTSA